jgi:hypothetical protein
MRARFPPLPAPEGRGILSPEDTNVFGEAGGFQNLPDKSLITAPTGLSVLSRRRFQKYEKRTRFQVWKSWRWEEEVLNRGVVFMGPVLCSVLSSTFGNER